MLTHLVLFVFTSETYAFPNKLCIHSQTFALFLLTNKNFAFPIHSAGAHKTRQMLYLLPKLLHSPNKFAFTQYMFCSQVQKLVMEIT